MGEGQLIYFRNYGRGSTNKKLILEFVDNKLIFKISDFSTILSHLKGKILTPEGVVNKYNFDTMEGFNKLKIDTMGGS